LLPYLGEHVPGPGPVSGRHGHQRLLLLRGVVAVGGAGAGLDPDLAQLKAQPRARQLLLALLLLRSLLLVGADSGHVRERHGGVELLLDVGAPAAALPVPVAVVRHDGALASVDWKVVGAEAKQQQLTSLPFRSLRRCGANEKKTREGTSTTARGPARLNKYLASPGSAGWEEGGASISPLGTRHVAAEPGSPPRSSRTGTRGGAARRDHQAGRWVARAR
jgi:hypothetical protein